MKRPGVLCGDDAVVTQYWNDRHSGPFVHANPVPSAEEIANEVEIARLHREELALALQLRDMTVRMKALAENPKPGPDSTIAHDIELVLQCLNEATYNR